MQSRGEGVRRASKSQFPEATKSLKAQHMYLGSILFLSKTAPSPVFKANPYMVYDLKTGRLVMTPERKAQLDKLESLLKGRIVNDNIDILEEDVELNPERIEEIIEDMDELEEDLTAEE